MSIWCWLGFHKKSEWIYLGPAWYMEPSHYYRICPRCGKKLYKVMY